jgi:hypothetical protein
VSLSPEALTRASSLHPWRTIVTWVLVVALAGWAASTLLAGVLTTEVAFTSEPEAVRANDLLEREFTGAGGNTEFLIVRAEGAASKTRRSATRSSGSPKRSTRSAPR